MKITVSKPVCELGTRVKFHVMDYVPVGNKGDYETVDYTGAGICQRIRCSLFFDYPFTDVIEVYDYEILDDNGFEYEAQEVWLPENEDTEHD